MERLAFKMLLHKGNEAEYKRRHDLLWPELTSLLKENGILEYAIFLDEESGILIGIMKVADSLKLKDLPKHPVMKKWWAYMKDIMATNEDDSPVSVPLTEVFYLS